MSHTNTLTWGGAGAGGVTAVQLSQDLALLSLSGLCAVDGELGCQFSLETYEAAMRVAGVFWAISITVVAAFVGRFIARFVESPPTSA